MELRHLRYFMAVAEAGHMTRAAERLGIQQPPLSLQIKSLENELGVALFHRHPKGVALSDAGRLFEVEARQLLDDMAAMEQRMARVARGELGVLNVGFTSSAAAHAFTPEALRACRRAWPGIALSIREDHAAGITASVEAGRSSAKRGSSDGAARWTRSSMTDATRATSATERACNPMVSRLGAK